MIASVSLDAQETTESKKYRIDIQVDRINDDDEIADSLKSSEFKEWDFSFWGMNSFNDLRRPTIELEYGMNEAHYNKDVFSQDFNPNNRFMGKIGFANYGETVAGSGLLKYNFSSLFAGHSFGDTENLSESGLINTSITSFGVMSSNGYGYTLSDNFFIILTHGGGLSWNLVNFTYPDGVIDASELDMIKVMDDGVRFGETFETGIKIRLIDNIGITGTYSENLIMPRFLIWHWSLGKLIEGTSQVFADFFVNRVKKTSPELVPILYFVVKNGISYGFNRLREKNMNWPSDTAPPLFQQNVNIGISFIF